MTHICVVRVCAHGFDNLVTIAKLGYVSITEFPFSKLGFQAKHVNTNVSEHVDTFVSLARIPVCLSSELNS